MLSTVICKPTKDCNADCSYCSSPPDQLGHWTFEQFKIAFDTLKPRLADEAVWIWHGGEPMLLGPDFYRQCWDYARAQIPGIKFSIQTNILLYSSKKWKAVFRDIFKGSISTSFDMDVRDRTLKGCPKRYEKKFKEKLSLMLADGFMPMVLSIFDEHNMDTASQFYEFSSNHEVAPFHVRMNYRYPLGRASGEEKELIAPKDYGDLLLDAYNRWIKDIPGFTVTPLNQMFEAAIGESAQRCPWTRHCVGGFVGIEPNGDVYNCSDFADLGDTSYRFGNIFDSTIDTRVVNFVKKADREDFISSALKSPAARDHARRRYNLPKDCTQCRHYTECNGGCVRDAVLYDRGMGGKFFYCESWIMVFDRIKESVLSGEADRLIKMLGYDIDDAKRYVQRNIQNV